MGGSEEEQAFAVFTDELALSTLPEIPSRHAHVESRQFPGLPVWKSCRTSFQRLSTLVLFLLAFQPTVPVLDFSNRK